MLMFVCCWEGEGWSVADCGRVEVVWADMARVNWHGGIPESMGSRRKVFTLPVWGGCLKFKSLIEIPVPNSH